MSAARPTYAAEARWFRIDGLKLLGPNAKRFTTLGGMRKEAKTVRRTREAALLRTKLAAAGRSVPPTTVHFARIGPGRLDDDNLIASFKHVRDGVAKALGVNDRRFVIVGDRSGIRVSHEQRSEGRGVYAVEVVLTWADA